jgi:hypothetical protein
MGDPCNYTVPSEYLAYFINRKLVQRDVYLTEASKFYALTFGKPILILVNRETTGR